MYIYLFHYIHIYIYICIYIYMENWGLVTYREAALMIDRCISDVSCLRLSCCINAFIFYVHCLCHIGCVYVLYVGHVDRVVYTKPFFHCNILSKHHHHQVHIYIIFNHFICAYTCLSYVDEFIYMYIYIWKIKN
jgi:hypothetical protein